LRKHQRGAESLYDAREDQYQRVGREAAEQRRRREQRHTEQEDPAVPVRLAEPSTGDQQYRERDQVAADDQRQQWTGRAELAVYRGGGDVGDRGVRLCHERRDEQYRQQPTAVYVSHEPTVPRPAGRPLAAIGPSVPGAGGLRRLRSAVQTERQLR